MKHILKSVGAILAGFLTVAILSVVTDLILETVGILPPATQPEAYVTWMLVLAFAYRSVYTIVGGYVTARLAPSKPMLHTMILAGLGFVAATLGLIANGDKISGQPWYPVALVVTAIPLVWLGGRLRMKQIGAKK